MRPIILFSKADVASMLTRQVLLESFNWRELYIEKNGEAVISDGTIIGLTTRKHHIYLKDEEIKGLGGDLIIVASSHRSEKGIKSLHAHSTGNWGAEVKLGGEPNKLSYTMAGALSVGFRKLSEAASEEDRLKDWLVSLEVTHHGPYSSVPLIFIEFGGPQSALLIREAAIVVAEACIAAANAHLSNKPAVGIGGGHYAPLFTTLTLQGEYDFGHIVPKYAFPISDELLLEAFDKTVEKTKLAIIDWKGTPGTYRQLIINVLKNQGIEVVKK